MKIENRDKFVILTDDKGNLKEFASFITFQIANKFKRQNVVIDLGAFDALELDQLLLFLKVSNLHRKTKHSFVIVNNAIDPDDVPFEMVVVPTLQEAADIIEMEEIERDLGS
ncbi:MAG: ribonuclease Z [Altibacter sp.]|uniref:ribonuclease Z n=1 Tax=Altibacter sp. TaxID=2024823 RepID=UPI001D6CA52A|nr:ribonuclease Z [Altibacter sp.]MBZ0326668.1 ribonuclease Z [Altibacter sp.]